MDTRERVSHDNFITIMSQLGYKIKRDEEGTPYVPCKHGRIEWQTYANDLVGLYTWGKIKLGLLREANWTINWQVAQDEGRFLISLGNLHKGTELLNPRMKRVLSPEERDKSIENLTLARAKRG